MTREEHIPRIIHQVFHNWRDPGNETIPSDWDEVRKGCQDKNPGWEYHVCLVYLWGVVKVKVEGRDSSEWEMNANVRNLLVMDGIEFEKIYRGELSLVFEDV